MGIKTNKSRQALLCSTHICQVRTYSGHQGTIKIKIKTKGGLVCHRWFLQSKS
mgnify:CR=1 FL=1